MDAQDKKETLWLEEGLKIEEGAPVGGGDNRIPSADNWMEKFGLIILFIVALLSLHN